MSQFLIGFLIALPTGISIWLASRLRRRQVVVHYPESTGR